MASFADAAQATVAAGDPYGRNSTGASGSSASFRQRGDATQKRVNNDTRVRNDANSGTAGAQGQAAGNVSMLDTLGGQNPAMAQQQSQPVQNASWQASRQPVDLASVRERVLQSFIPQQGQ